jgi:diguanylate cyclase (GGDEF)-like protein
MQQKKTHRNPFRGSSFPAAQPIIKAELHPSKPKSGLLGLNTEGPPRMITLKKYLELDASELIHPEQPGDLFSSVLECYRSALAAMGDCGTQVCPALGPELQQGLRGLSERLSQKVTPAAVRGTEQCVEEQLQRWGGRAAQYFQEKAGEVKEILMVLAQAAETAAERDQRHGRQFGEFITRLQSMAKLEDLPQIRASVMRSARDLRTCVEKMEQDSNEAVSQLRAQVSTYQSRLEEAEKRASLDALTGLDNRHGVESKIERRILAQQRFSVVMLDLNGFKQVNDTYGHLTGDELLKQFANELRSASRSTDVVGRWGGDEFIVVLDCGYTEAQSHIGRMQKWVLGEYAVGADAITPKVTLGASIGLAEWQPGETIKEVLGRADCAMYQQKAEARKSAPGNRRDA